MINVNSRLRWAVARDLPDEVAQEKLQKLMEQARMRSPTGGFGLKRLGSLGSRALATSRQLFALRSYFPNMTLGIRVSKQYPIWALNSINEIHRGSSGLHITIWTCTHYNPSCHFMFPACNIPKGCLDPG